MRVRASQGSSTRHASVGTSRAPEKPRVTPPAGATPPSPPWWRGWLLVWAVAVFLLLFFGPGLYVSARTQQLPYSTFLTDLQRHQVVRSRWAATARSLGR